MLASFIKEARDRGYERAIVGGFESFPGFWELVKAAGGSLHNCYYPGYVRWDDPAYINLIKEHAQRYRGGKAEALVNGTGYTSGWADGIVMADAIRRAVEAVGAEKVDGSAIRNAVATTNLTVEGYGNPWRFDENINFACQTQIIFEWNTAEERWESIGDWITPLSLAGS
jgi:hypothetical protein